MKIHNFHDQVFIEDFHFNADDFEIEYSKIHHSEHSKKFVVDVTAKPTGEMAKVIEAVNFSERQCTQGYKKEYDFRGRRTDEQKRDAENEAREKLNKRIDSGYYADRLLSNIQKSLTKKVEYSNNSYLGYVERRFKDSTPVTFRDGEDKELDYYREQLDSVNNAIDALKKVRNVWQKELRHRKNTLLAKDIESIGLNGMAKDSDYSFPKIAEDKLLEMAKSDELFEPARIPSFN